MRARPYVRGTDIHGYLRESPCGPQRQPAERERSTNNRFSDLIKEYAGGKAVIKLFPGNCLIDVS